MNDEDKLIQSFKTLNIIYMALGAGMLMSSAVFVFLVGSGNAITKPELADVLKMVVPVIAVSGYIGGKFLYGTMAKKSKVETTDQTKRFTNYQTAFLIVWALLEGPGLFAAISYYLTGDQIFLAFFALVFLGYLFSKPSVNKFQQDF